VLGRLGDDAHAHGARVTTTDDVMTPTPQRKRERRVRSWLDSESNPEWHRRPPVGRSCAKLRIFPPSTWPANPCRETIFRRQGRQPNRETAKNGSAPAGCSSKHSRDARVLPNHPRRKIPVLARGDPESSPALPVSLTTHFAMPCCEGSHGEREPCGKICRSYWLFGSSQARRPAKM